MAFRQRNNKKNLAQDAIKKEIILKALEEKTTDERDNLISFMKWFFKAEKNRDFDSNWHYDLIADKLKGVIEWKVNRLMINLPPRHWKKISNDTLIPTIKWYKTHWELQIWDKLFWIDGKITTVTHCSETTNDIDLEVTFANKWVIKAHKEHLWTVFDKGLNKYRTIDTQTMVNDWLIRKDGKWNRFLVDFTKPVEYIKNNLSINPYLLWLWLWDWTSADWKLNMCEEDLDVVLKKDFWFELWYRIKHKTTWVITQYFKWLATKLRKLELLNNKHIPNIYLQSNIEDRMELLRGLIDSDWSIDKSWRIRFINTNINIINWVKELVSSLWFRITEYKPKINTFHRLLNGYIIKDTKQCYVVWFSPYVEDIFSHLPRKQKNVKKCLYRRNAIISINKIPSVSWKCIQVDNKDHLYLVWKSYIPTHNTELITKCFPVWALWSNPYLEIISTSYSATLAQEFSSEARDYYNSKWFNSIFPRNTKIKDSQNTKDYWKLETWGSYYATGSGWSITWRWASIFLVDDPLKPDEVDSDIKRIWINNWFENTVVSRLNNPKKDSIIIIMQRLHDNDLCWFLREKMDDWTWDEWDIVNLPAIAEEKEEFTLSDWRVVWREIWEALFPARFDLEVLAKIRKWRELIFSCQYQQDPISKENQEFHEEWFKYYKWTPSEQWRIFTTTDPAFSKKKSADDSVVTTAKFVWDEMYILEQTVWKYDPAELEDIMVNHIKKWNPEKIWIESIAAQVTITFSLRRRLKKEWIYKTEIVEIRQKEDKWAKIRSLIPLYRNWLIHHKEDMRWEKLESQLLKFPRWRHDDCPDWLQMLLYLYELQPNVWMKYKMPKIKYTANWMPVIVK